MDVAARRGSLLDLCSLGNGVRNRRMSGFCLLTSLRCRCSSQYLTSKRSGIAHPPQVLSAHMRCLGAVLAIPGVIDDQRTPRAWCGTRVRQQQLQPPRVDNLIIPASLGQEVLQPLHRSVLRLFDWLRPRQTRQRLIAIPRRQQPGQILPEPAPLRQRTKQPIKVDTIVFQRTRQGRTLLKHVHREPLPGRAPSELPLPQ